MPIDINGSGTITGLSVGGLEDGIITPSELSTGAPTWDSQGNVGNIASINSGPLAGFRNAIINGNFDVWQRGTSFTATGYGADRWNNLVAGATATMSRQAFTLGQTDVPGEPAFFARFAITSVTGASNRVLIYQPIESVRTFAGQQVTLSFYAKADATKNIAFKFYQQFGTGGSPSAITDNIAVTKVAIGTTWQRITKTFTAPSITGKTLGTDGNSSLSLEIYFDAGSNWNTSTDSLGHQSGTFDIAQVQVEAGPVATPFERRPIGTELALCQRYFWHSSTAQGRPIGVGQAVSTSTAGYVVALPAPLRTTSVSVTPNNLYGTNAGGSLTLFSSMSNYLVADVSKLYILLAGATGLTAGHGSLLAIGATGVDGSLSVSAEL